MLAFMLLKPNEVVPTSQLLDALWPGDDIPVTARKMLQNAAWGLRTVLSSAGTSQVRLVTRPPGYALEVETEAIDFQVFRRIAGQGKARLAAGDHAAAADMLCEGLSMWRGKPLSDLTERGISWPELTLIERARLNTLEDYFDAQLGCGRHHDVLVDLEELVEAEPLRERPCGQLMLALYRSGRHTDALAVFSRTRSAMVDELGLEPSPVLQRLQQAILRHDVSLLLPRDPHHTAPVATTPEALAAQLPPARPVPVTPARTMPAGERIAGLQRLRLTTVVLGVDVDMELEAGPVTGTERARPSPTTPTSGWADADEALDGVTRMVRAGIERLGATVAGSIGSALLAMFPADRSEDGATAVRALLIVRDCFSTTTTATAIPRVSISAAVVTGDAIAQFGEDDTPGGLTLAGGLVDECNRLHARVPPGEVWIDDETYRISKQALICQRMEDTVQVVWRVTGTREPRAGSQDPRTTDDECPVAVVNSLLGLVRCRAQPHLVVVVGDRWEARWSFITTLERTLLASPDIRLSRPPLGEHRSGALATGGLAAPRQSTPDRETASPTVLVLEDLGHADDQLLDEIERIVETTPDRPLLLVVTAGAELLSRRPHWASRPHTACITVDSAFDRAVADLRASLVSSLDPYTKELARGMFEVRSAGA